MPRTHIRTHLRSGQFYLWPLGRFRVQTDELALSVGCGKLSFPLIIYELFACQPCSGVHRKYHPPGAASRHLKHTVYMTLSAIASRSRTSVVFDKLPATALHSGFVTTRRTERPIERRFPLVRLRVAAMRIKGRPCVETSSTSANWIIIFCINRILVTVWVRPWINIPLTSPGVHAAAATTTL